MNNENIKEIYNAWANPVSDWSGWVKPVLFAHLSEQYENIDKLQLKNSLPDVSWVPENERNMAVVIDLPGADSLRLAIKLAYKGYQPVPLYNCAPDSRGLIEMRGVMSILLAGSEILEQLPPPVGAPPVFILDSHRLQGRASPGRYDNRWVVLPQDFPSSNMLLGHNIKNVLVVQDSLYQPAEDLRHVLKRWQNAGIEIMVTAIDQPENMTKMEITTPSNFQSLVYRALVLIGLRRNSAGGFGALVPEPSSSGGFS
ncbi:MAG: hypothetical protein ABFD79_11930 [Phycisphaerales bacterium]